MTKTSPSPSTWHPCQDGSDRPRPSRARASPIAMPSTVMANASLQTVWPRNAKHALEHGYPDRQIAVHIEERGERLGRLNGDEFSDGQSACRVQPIETDRDAIRDVPNVAWRRLSDR